jgi:hypothetical protein
MLHAPSAPLCLPGGRCSARMWPRVPLFRSRSAVGGKRPAWRGSWLRQCTLPQRPCLPWQAFQGASPTRLLPPVAVHTHMLSIPAKGDCSSHKPTLESLCCTRVRSLASPAHEPPPQRRRGPSQCGGPPERGPAAVQRAGCSRGGGGTAAAGDGAQGVGGPGTGHHVQVPNLGRAGGGLPCLA